MAKSDKSVGGYARASSLSSQRRKQIASNAASSRWDKVKNIPKASYTGTLSIGDMTFPCSVLSNGDRILTQTDFMNGMGMYYSGWVSKNRSAEDAAADVPAFLSFKSIKPFIDKHLGQLQSIVIKYRTERGNLAHGIKADIIPRICDVWIDADEMGTLGTRQKQVACKARLLMRSLAHVGIIALVDEATGYQRDRASNALSEILESFIAKELQPWVKTFPDEYYEQLFRLRGLVYPRDSVKKPQYFGHLTNDIIYKRLAPSVLDELKKIVPRTTTGRLKNCLHQKLTSEMGHPKLREHMSSVVTAMKLSNDYEDFMKKLDMLHPRFDNPMPMESVFDGPQDTGTGL